MKLSAVMMVRNEASILATNLAYHRGQGIDGFWIIDNGSSDGTQAILESESRAFGDVRWRSESDGFNQSEATTAAAADAIAAGADWVVPIDADEFWVSSRGTIHKNLVGKRKVGAYECQVDNFVQRRRERVERSDSITKMVYRAEPVGTITSARDLVTRRQIGFVEMLYPPKVIVRAAQGLVIRRGSHGADNLDGPVSPAPDLRVLHAPIRSRSALVKRANHGVRLSEVSQDPDVGWHLRRWSQLRDEGSLEEDWNANSHRFGHLSVNHERRSLRRDLRLRNAVSPFVRSTR